MKPSIARHVLRHQAERAAEERIEILPGDDFRTLTSGWVRTTGGGAMHYQAGEVVSTGDGWTVTELEQVRDKLGLRRARAAQRRRGDRR